jgi:hypothetical protein
MVTGIKMACSAEVASAAKAVLEYWKIGIMGLVNDPARASNF